MESIDENVVIVYLKPYGDAIVFNMERQYKCKAYLKHATNQIINILTKLNTSPKHATNVKKLKGKINCWPGVRSRAKALP